MNRIVFQIAAFLEAGLLGCCFWELYFFITPEANSFLVVISSQYLYLANSFNIVDILSVHQPIDKPKLELTLSLLDLRLRFRDYNYFFYI